MKSVIVKFFQGHLFFWLVIFIVVFVTVHFIHEKFIFGKQYEGYFFTNYKPYPYSMFKWGDNYEDPIPKKKKEEFRIFILGGSAVAQGDPPFPELLEEIFHEKGYKEVKVFNFGVISSMTGQDLARILYEVVDLLPDLIVMYNGYNDLAHPFYADPRPGYPFNFMVYENNPISSSSLSFPWVLSLYRSSILRQLYPYFFMKQFTKIDKLRKQAGYGTKEWKKQIVSAYWNYVKKAQKISLAFDFDLLVVFQAVVFGKKKNFVRENEQMFFVKDWHFMFEYLLKLTNQDKNVLFFDRSGIFDHNEEKVFNDFVHIKQEYQKDVAKELFSIIISDKKFNSRFQR